MYIKVLKPFKDSESGKEVAAGFIIPVNEKRGKAIVDGKYGVEVNVEEPKTDEPKTK
jgi:hypothetical protein